MTRIDPTRQPTAPPERDRTRHGIRIAVALLASTVALGAAARLAEQAPDPAPGPALATHFSAPKAGPVHFTGLLEGTAVLPDQDGLVRIELGLDAEGAAAAEALRVATDLVVVLDRSGSMTGEKLVQARAAVHALVEALAASDRFALVTYADSASAVIPLAAPGADRLRWHAQVDAIHADGGTNLSSGLDAALAMVESARRAGRVPRVLLISDGLANQGDASRSGLVARARRAARGEFALSTIGVGADFDEGLMAALADAGTGNFHFLASAAGLGQILGDEFATARETVASGLRVSIEPAAGVSIVDAAGYPLEQGDGRVAFRPGSLFAGQERRIWVTLRVAPGARGAVPLGVFSLEYVTGAERHRVAFAEAPRVSAVADEATYYGSLDREQWARGVLVDQTNALRRSVAEALQEGRESDALEAIGRYRADVAAKNAHVKSEAVARQLEEAEDLELRVQDAASGAAPMAPAETKTLRALGYSAGRPGSRK